MYDTEQYGGKETPSDFKFEVIAIKVGDGSDGSMHLGVLTPFGCLYPFLRAILFPPPINMITIPKTAPAHWHRQNDIDTLHPLEACFVFSQVLSKAHGWDMHLQIKESRGDGSLYTSANSCCFGNQRIVSLNRKGSGSRNNLCGHCANRC
jgi:hypothetical protein